MLGGSDIVTAQITQMHKKEEDGDKASMGGLGEQHNR
jgi:hypothetical protein